MALLPTQTPNTNGAVTVYTAAALTNTFVNNGRTLLLVKNGSGSSINATVITQIADIDGNVVPDKVIAIAAGAEKLIGPFPPGIYNDTTGVAEVDISVVTSITIACIQVP